MKVYPTFEFKFSNLTTGQNMEAARKAARLLPMTFAAITGADGRSLIVLVSICDEEGSTPEKEADAEQLYQHAYEQAKPLYLSQLQAELKEEKPTMKANFMLTLDPSPYYNSKAVAMRISRNRLTTAAVPKAVDSLKAFNDYEFLYRKAAKEAAEEMVEAEMNWTNEKDQLLARISAIATKSATWDSAKRRLSSTYAETTGTKRPKSSSDRWWEAPMPLTVKTRKRRVQPQEKAGQTSFR